MGFRLLFSETPKLESGDLIWIENSFERLDKSISPFVWHSDYAHFNRCGSHCSRDDAQRWDRIRHECVCESTKKERENIAKTQQCCLMKNEDKDDVMSSEFMACLFSHDPISKRYTHGIPNRAKNNNRIYFWYTRLEWSSYRGRFFFGNWFMLGLMYTSNSIILTSIQSVFFASHKIPEHMFPLTLFFV